MKTEADLLRSGASWHDERYELLEKSRRRAWILAAMQAALLALSLVALVLLIPLKETVPYVITKDRETGYIEVARSADALSLSADEALAEFNLLRYVASREGYDPDPANLRASYELVYAYSSGPTWEPYHALYQRGTPGNLLERYRHDTRVSVAVKNVSFLEAGRALVRFSTTAEKDGQSETQHWAATVGFRYGTPPRLFTERAKNPLGFEVTSYRRDQEVVRADSQN